MSEMDELRRAMCHEPEPSRRERRAAHTRAEALSLQRIGMSLLSFPFVAVTVAVLIYIFTSPYRPTEALAHLIARIDCDAAQSMGLAPAYRGRPGYHLRNDVDGDGVACETVVPARQDAAQTLDSAKFVKP